MFFSIFSAFFRVFTINVDGRLASRFLFLASNKLGVVPKTMVPKTLKSTEGFRHTNEMPNWFYYPNGSKSFLNGFI